MSKQPWSRGDKLALIAFIVTACLTLVGVIAAVFVVPEFRRAVGLDHSDTVNLSTAQMTLTTFCDALKKGEYLTAWDLLSSDTKIKYSEPQFATDYSNNGGAGHITDCTVSNTKESGSSATGTLTFTYVTGNKGVDYITLVKENGQWKLENSYSPHS